MIGRVRDFAAANTGAVTAAGVAAGVAAAAVAAIAIAQNNGGGKPDVTADGPAGVVTTAPATPGTSTTPSPQESPSASAPTPTLSASPSASPSASLSPTPSTSASASPTASPSATPSESPTAPNDVPVAAPVIGDPVVDVDSGAVTFTVADMSPTSTLTVAMQSEDTTFDAPPAGCTLDGDRRVACTPGVASLRSGRSVVRVADTADYTVTLPLTFPAYMEEDELRFTASVDGDLVARVATTSFRPSRAPSFDFAQAPLEVADHTLSDDAGTDRYDVPTTAVLPRRVMGLGWTVTGARFRGVPGDGCAVSDDGGTLTCDDVADGDRVVLPLAADGLSDAATATVTVRPPRRFTDPDDANERQDVALRPGADLGLDLAVFSANPDRGGLVSLTGTLTGVRPGVDRVTYSVVDGAATLRAADNPDCAASDGGLDCPVAPDGTVALAVHPDNRNAQTPVALAVAPVAPFEAVGAGHRAEVVLPGRPTHDFSLTDLRESAHTVDGDTDTYTLSGLLGALPADVTSLDLSLTGATAAAGQGDARCAALDARTLRCTGLGDDPDLSLRVQSDATRTHDVTVEVQPADPYDDDVTSNNTASVPVSPGTDLVLTPRDLGAVHRGEGGYVVSTHVEGLRTGLPSVTYTTGDGVEITGSSTDGCTVSAIGLTCEEPVAEDVTLALRSSTPDETTPLSITATPGGDFVQLGEDNTATGSLVASYDFALGDLSLRDQTLADGKDRYTLRSRVEALPPGLDTATLEVEGGTLAPDQGTGCTRQDATTLTCGDLASARAVDVVVDADGVSRPDVTLTLVVPAGVDDSAPGNESATVTALRPGVDLALSPLRPDNASPANDDDQHLVTTTLSGVRHGLAEVTYTLDGRATFVRADGAGCRSDGTTLTCEDPADGPVTFTVRAADTRAATDVTIAVAAPAPFVELAPGDNADAVRLAARPTYDFSLSALTETGHTVSGDTDTHTLRSTLGALPAGLDELGLTVAGGTFAASQPAGCSVVDATHVTCSDLASARTADLRVTSSRSVAHDVTLSVQVPRRYDDTDASDDSRTLQVAPGVDLVAAAATPADPLPTATGAYTVTTHVSGVRSGLAGVRWTATGATVSSVRGTGCARDGATVLCSSPADGQDVTFTLQPATPRAATRVTLTAAPTGAFTEVASADNAVTTTLAPDPVLASVVEAADTASYASMHAQVTGMPAGVSIIRIRLDGAGVGLGAGQVHLTQGANGADGEGGVDCYTSDSTGASQTNGLFATCIGVATATSGSFFLDLRLAHPHGTATPVTFTLVPLGVDQGVHTGNDAVTTTVR